MSGPSSQATGASRLPLIATVATIAVLLLLFVERSILAEPVRGLLERLHLDPALFRAGIAVLSVLLPILLAAVAWRLRARIFPAGSGRPRTVACLVLLGVYALTVWLPILFTSDPAARSAYRLIQDLAVPLTIAGFGFLLPAIVRRAGYEAIFRTFLVVSVAYGLVSLAWVVLGQQSFFGIPLTPQPDDRGGRWEASGFFVQRNTIGSFLLVVIPPAVWLTIGEVRRRQMGRAALAGLGTLVLFVWLALTFSRSSQLGVAVGLVGAGLAWAWLGAPDSARGAQLQRVTRNLSLTAVVLGAVAALSAPWWLPQLTPSLATTISDGLHGRGSIWLDIWDKTANHRWIGTGLFGVEALGPGGVQYGEVYTPHNAFLAQLAYFGVPGLVAFVLLLAMMVQEGWARRRRGFGLQDAIVLGAIGGILAQNLFEHILTNPVLFSNSFSFLLLGLWRAGRPEPNDAEAPGSTA